MQNDKFDAIPIPEELNQAVRAGIKEGLRQRRKLCRRRTAFRYSAAAAGILAALCAGMLLASNPVLAAKLPLIGRIFSLVQEKVSYKGRFSDDAEIYIKDGSSETPSGSEKHAAPSKSDNMAGKQTENLLVQTSGGLTVTVSETNCSAQALYLALCIENEEAFPADFIKTKNMDGYLPDYDSLSLETNSYYNVPGLTKKDRPAGGGYPTPYYIEGQFVDDHTFTGIIRVSLDEDLRSSAAAGTDTTLSSDKKNTALPAEFMYYLEISDIYADLLQYEETYATDPETHEQVALSEPLKKHYKGKWNFAIPVSMNKGDAQTVNINRKNENGVGIGSVEKTNFEIKAELLLPENAQPYDYIVAICDADGKRLESQGDNSEVFSTYGRDTQTVYVYVCDYIKYMDELKGDDRKLAENALFETEVHFK
ncbi:MAG: hypothetical protein HFI55_14840 [Lachnospiraceae bacterium]|jgi:hypothetical protein|nr:hypothetical protein [Lachnospiraceae bacterium]